ncbi:ABC transporter permease [Desulforhopalus sp. IMCC35007]|uniref:ABC transporter permease n=1 Tax=Desulforhopalus sp. IMCC35007 TaxID=2569543 RepID=UPI00197A961E|nr:FtsX-like permease family protein [Desulforhopalus sp. IMCC35007]
MIKHLKIIEYALSSLLRRKTKIIAIFIAYTLTVATLASVLFLTHALKTEATHILQGVPDLIVQRILGGRHDLIPVDYAEKIKDIFGVSEVKPRYWGYYYDALTEANYTVMGAGDAALELKLLDGKLPATEFECAVGKGVAALRGADYSNELILVNSRNIGVLFDVSGIFQSDSSLLTNDLVLLTNEAVIDFFGFEPGRATDLAVTVQNSNELQTVAVKIKKLFPDARPITKRELTRTYDMVFNWRSGMMLTVFCAAIMALCIMAWDKATGISAEEKLEIGILKAIGWDTDDVLILKFWEGVIVSMTSFLTGLLLSYVHVFYFDAFVLSTILKGWSVLFPAFQLTPSVNVLHIFTMFFLTVVPYIASTVIPTWKTAVTDPESVMRG